MKPLPVSSNIIQPHTYQRGLTLVEVMIAITISLVLLAGVMQIFTGSRQTYRVQDNMARLQENGRFAMSFLTRGIRSSDFWGCLRDPSVLQNNLNPAGIGFVAFNAAGGITGTENTGLNGSDTITLVAGTSAPGLNITAPWMRDAAVPLTAPIQVSTPNGLNVGDIVIVANCRNADMFQIQSGNPGGAVGPPGVAGSVIHALGVPVPAPPAGPGNINAALSVAYDNTARFFSIQTITYSIQADPANNNTPSLFQSINGGAAVVLVEGVENMQILYGENTTAAPIPPAIPTDANFSADRYIPANLVGNWAEVVSVRVSVVMRTQENNLATAPQPYTINGALITPPSTDLRLRRVFSTTVSLRNRGE